MNHFPVDTYWQNKVWGDLVDRDPFSDQQEAVGSIVVNTAIYMYLAGDPYM